jgi:hypothetical protein
MVLEHGLKLLNNQADFDSAILSLAQAKRWCRNQEVAVGFGSSFGSPAFEKAPLGQ